MSEDLLPLPDWVEAMMPKRAETSTEPQKSPLIGEQIGPKLTPVSSSNITAIGHDGTALYIRFNSGGLYRYPTAGADVHAAFLAAESAGRYFHVNIKPFHTGEKMS